MYEIRKYGKKNWAVFDGATLICVTTYKKGAIATKERLDEQGMMIAHLESELDAARRHCLRSADAHPAVAL